jgi:hypothetical protein
MYLLLIRNNLIGMMVGLDFEIIFMIIMDQIVNFRNY